MDAVARCAADAGGRPPGNKGFNDGLIWLLLLLLLFKPSCLCSDPIGRAFPPLPCLIIQLGDTDQLAMPMQCQVALCPVVLCGPGLSWRS